jgi:hypothetical protein
LIQIKVVIAERPSRVKAAHAQTGSRQTLARGKIDARREDQVQGGPTKVPITRPEEMPREN